MLAARVHAQGLHKTDILLMPHDAVVCRARNSLVGVVKHHQGTFSSDTVAVGVNVMPKIKQCKILGVSKQIAFF